MNLTCAIVDDQELMVNLFTDYVQGIEGLELRGAYTNAVEALKQLVKSPPDILFLDIQMPNLTGLDIVQSLPTLPYIIFITSSPDFAIESYSLNVADYLLKPVKEDRFRQAVEKAFKRLRPNPINDNTTPLPTLNDYTFIKIDTKYIRIYFDDIIYIEAEKDFTRIFTTGATLISSVTMKTFDETLPKTQFIRTHRSYLVNLKHVQSIEVDVINTAKGQIPLGITFKEAVLEKVIGKRLIR